MSALSFQQGNMSYVQSNGAASNSVTFPFVAARAPASTDVLYGIGKMWINTAAQNVYVLSALSVSNGVTSAAWTLLGAVAGNLNTLTTDDLTVVVPSAGNINLAGSGSIATSGSGATATIGLTGLTNHSVLVGAGSSTITKLTVGTTGQVLIGSTGADPAFGALGVNSGLTNHGVLLGQNNSAFVATAAGATGQALMGSTGADPAWSGSPSFSGSVTAGTTLTATLGNITATNGNLSLATIGNKVIIATGLNASVGTSSAMSGTPGSVTVATTASSATAKIFYSRATAGGTLGNVSISAQDGTGFTLLSTANETSTFNYWIINA